MRFQHECFVFLAQSSFDSIWFRHFADDAETRLRALQLSILTNVYVSCLPCPRQLSRYSSPACNGKLASFSAASCRCDVIWIWRYQRHRTACYGIDSTSDAPARLLRPVHQRLSGSQVSAHWCFYERTSEREVEYKRLMSVCRRSLLWNSATDDDIDAGISTVDAASFKILMPR